jgi:hypothetical protein
VERQVVIRALLLVALAGCLPKTYHCESSSDCGTGVCESTGFCSYADSTCSGGQRYGDLSGSYTGQCVGQVTGSDARVDTIATGDGMRDGAPDAPTAFCDTADTTLVGCWEFEGNVNDASGQNNNGTATSVSYATGKVGMAAVLTASSHIAVPDNASLFTQTGQVTVEGWINPSSLPTGTARMGIVDDDSRWGLFIYAGEIRWTTNTTNATVTLPTSQWSHVASTWDGTTAIIYVNGSVAGMMSGGGGVGAGNGNGVALGGNSPSADTLDGMIDQFRIFNMPRTAGQICHDAGKTTCP